MKAGHASVTLESPLIEAFVDAVGEMRGSRASERAAHVERLAQSPVDLHAVVARIDGRVAGAGLIALEGDVAGVFDVITDAAHLRRGVGTAVTSALLRRAWDRGARHVYLQVSADNAPALALYRPFGFTTLYTYHYRARPHEVE